MEHYDMQRQRRDTKNKGRNVVWSIAMDKCLIEALAVQAKSGNKIDKCFNENAYTAACVAVNTRFNLNLNSQKVINRLKTIKKRYKVIGDMLSQDGFWWNPNSKMIECDSDELWKKYVAANPDARGLRGKQIEMYDELKIVCGNYQAPSRWARMKRGSHLMNTKNCGDESASFASPSSEDMSETDGTESYTGPPEFGQMPDGFQEPPVGQPVRQLPKRSRGSDGLQDALMTVASSLRRLADAMEQSKSSVDASELLQAVMEIDGLEEGKQMYAFEYLNADPVKARAFLTYNARMRKIYLFRQFSWWR
ncbi:L10-interacting MYB domain-containing protein [Abrus precatorius]|uniref:L10-interacting MYB domain-containing protein n=1 Tax=Abrus precatorius TaxID=3816 RepID=A0A8B8KFH4_ABRPR|nr:L10-interacting MYB domain-containing protein [Abrus precatorius]XP_027342555.1 L10-interacting MYB domain-containing protein [Abrus precatorius]XP_027342556.1 L10-interacting MYB domain-containing protein [Abrus precatorius]XP_027342557.1 L10-interacting MYB domain-containing protein [Abrus precatorius]